MADSSHMALSGNPSKLQGERVITVRLKGSFEKAIAFFEEDPFISNIVETDSGMALHFHIKEQKKIKSALLKRAVIERCCNSFIYGTCDES